MVCRVCKNHHGHCECLNRGRPGVDTANAGTLPALRCGGTPRLWLSPGAGSTQGRLGAPPAGWAPAATATLQNPNNPCFMELRWLKGAKLAEKWSKLLVSYCPGCTALHQVPRRCSGTSDRTTFWSNGALVQCCFFTSGRQRVTLSHRSLLMRSPI